MPVKESNARIQITIDKDVLKYLDYVIQEINRHTKTGCITRSSILVNSFITLFMSEAAKVQEKNENLKKEEEDQ